MSGQIVRFQSSEGPRWGVLSGSAPGDPETQLTISPMTGNAVTTADVIAAFDAGDIESGPEQAIAARNVLSPITTDAVIFCQGLNYSDHAAEADHLDRKANLIFNKASSSLCGPYDDIIRPAHVELLDYEVELGVVLRRPLDRPIDIDATNIGDYVAGFVLANDVSARDAMFGASFFQWFEGKSYRTFCPCGPVLWLLAPDEVAPAIDELEIRLALNGEQRQCARSSQLVWKPAETLTQLSRKFDLKAGDLLLSGTPGGVTAGVTPRVASILKDMLFDDAGRSVALRAELQTGRPFMQPGDVVTASLTDMRRGLSLGSMKNTIRSAG